MGLKLEAPFGEMGVQLVNEELGHVRVVVKCRNYIVGQEVFQCSSNNWKYKVIN